MVDGERVRRGLVTCPSQTSHNPETGQWRSGVRLDEFRSRREPQWGHRDPAPASARLGPAKSCQGRQVGDKLMEPHRPFLQNIKQGNTPKLISFANIL
jgi:hypothetical protein